MLGDELNRHKPLELSKSSFLNEQADEKRLKEMIEERDKTIRRLSKKIDKLQATLKKTSTSKNTNENDHQANNQQHEYFEMLKAEVGKSKQLEDALRGITSRLNLLLEDLAQDNSFADNSEELRQFLVELGAQDHASVSLESYEDQLHNSFSISQEWIKIIDILEGTVRGFKIKCSAFKQERSRMEDSLRTAQARIEELTLRMSSNEEMLVLSAELKEERKQREKFRGLLDKSQRQKNELINRINAIGLKDSTAIKAKTKEELLQFSKELSYRVQDLEKEKMDILKEANKEKETELRKYQDVLKKLRTIKETSRLGKSYA